MNVIPPQGVSPYPFTYICAIELRRSVDGELLTSTPQDRYNNLGNLELNAYGDGDFCHFSIPPNIHESGVYMICKHEGTINYIGECVDLSKRYNMGYGVISPRNCFERGQPTNCRLNKLILKSTQAGESLHLWFHNTRNFKEIELELRQRINAPWNKR